MLALALAAAVQTTALDRDDSRAAEIVVTAMRRLEDWRGVLVFQTQSPDCRVLASVNDRDLDAIGCKTMVQCYAEAKPRFLSVNDRALTQRQRRQIRLSANRDMETCFKTTRRAMVLELYKRTYPDDPLPAESETKAN